MNLPIQLRPGVWFVLLLGLAAGVQAQSEVLKSPGQAQPVPVIRVGPPGLVWDSESKEITPKPGETNVTFLFTATNVTDAVITVQKVQPSCGCSVARTPADPWKLAPGAHGTMEVDIDVRGKYGTLVKNALVTTTAGFKALQMRVNLPEPDNAYRAMTAIGDRVKNIHLAMADRQIVFKGDCASCHSKPGEGKHGQALYYAVCAICHEAAHRASMVTDLAALPAPLTREYWQTMVADGKVGTLMPAFSKRADHGPLDDAQIKSLVDYLLVRFPGRQPGEGPKPLIGPQAPPR